MAHALSVRLPGLSAAVPFYGNHPAAEDAVKVKAPLLIHFAGVDERINAGIPRPADQRLLNDVLQQALEIKPPIQGGILDHGAQQVIVYDLLGRRTSILVDTTNSNYILIPVLIASGAT